MKRPTENRSLDRGLAILESLSIHGASSLRDLHARTALPKSTIRRLLGTLIRRKIVRRSLADRLYRANIALPLQGPVASTPSEGWLVDRAVPHMIELTRSVGWACDLHIFERTRSRIIESTRPLSPFFQYSRPIDLQVTVFGSAAGLAVLSTWTDAAVLALIDEIGDDPVWGLRRVGLTRPRARQVPAASAGGGFRQPSQTLSRRDGHGQHAERDRLPDLSSANRGRCTGHALA